MKACSSIEISTMLRLTLIVSIWNTELGNRPLVYPFSKGKFKKLGLLNANAFLDINNNLTV